MCYKNVCFSKNQKSSNIAKKIWKKKLLNKLEPTQFQFQFKIDSTKALNDTELYKELTEPMNLEQKNNEKSQQIINEKTQEKIQNELEVENGESIDTDLKNLKLIQRKEKILRELAYLFSRIY